MNSVRMLLLLALLIMPSLSYAQWTNEPAGSIPIVDIPFSDSIGPLHSVYGSATDKFASFGNAPFSPTRVFDTYLDVGASTGNGQWTLALNNVKDLYIGTWWSTNADFIGLCNNGNKMLFLRRPDIDNNFLLWQGLPGAPKTLKWDMQATYDNCGHPGEYGMCYSKGDGTGWFEPNVSSGTVSAGSGWHKIELYLKSSTTTTSRDGILRWWLDGQLVGNYPTVNMSPGGFQDFEINHTWDGSSCLVPPNRDMTKAWHHYWDHLHISTTDCNQNPSACGVGPPPPPPPPSPTPPSPTPPPPPPPSTCGASGTTLFDSVTDFCSTQGPRWYYLNGDLSQMSSSGTIWNGAQLYQGIWDTGQHPGATSAAIRRWVAPSTGTWNISGVTGDYDAGGGDGVTVTIKKNNTTTLYTRTIPNGGGDVTYALSQALVSGDTLEFAVSAGATNVYDSTHFTATMTLGAAPPPGPPPPPPPPVLPQNCVLQWEANGESDVSFYRVYWGTASGVYGVPLAVPLSSNPFTSCARLGITAAGTYYFAVSAVDTSGNEGAKSSEKSTVFTGATVDVTGPGAPQNVSAQ